MESAINWNQNEIGSLDVAINSTISLHQIEVDSLESLISTTAGSGGNEMPYILSLDVALNSTILENQSNLNSLEVSLPLLNTTYSISGATPVSSLSNINWTGSAVELEFEDGSMIRITGSTVQRFS